MIADMYKIIRPNVGKSKKVTVSGKTKKVVIENTNKINFIINNIDTENDKINKQINDMIEKKNKKQKGGKINKITDDDKIFLLIPSTA